MPWTAPGVTGWGAIFLLAIVGTYFARLLMFASVARIGGGQTSLLSPLETFLAVIWSYLFLGERLEPVQLVGGTLILLSAMLAIKRLHRTNRRQRWRFWARSSELMVCRPKLTNWASKCRRARWKLCEEPNTS